MYYTDYYYGTIVVNRSYIYIYEKYRSNHGYYIYTDYCGFLLYLDYGLYTQATTFMVGFYHIIRCTIRSRRNQGATVRLSKKYWLVVSSFNPSEKY